MVFVLVFGKLPDASALVTGSQEKTSAQYTQLLDWMQRGVDEHVPASLREGLPALTDIMRMREDRVMVAKRDLYDGELLIRLPVQRLMHSGFYKGAEAPASGEGSTPASSASQGELAKAFHKGLEGHEFLTFVATQTWLALYLMEHRRQGGTSEWAHYINSLPANYPSVPLFYKDDDWQWLKGSSFQRRVEKHRENLWKQWETVSEHIPGFNTTYTFDQFLWARTAISTRVFGWKLPGLGDEDTDFMVPLGDMFNHRSPKQIEWFFNSTTKTLDYWARENVSAGQEMLISYGSKCNSQYVLHYGFALPNVSTRSPSPSTVRLPMPVDVNVDQREARVRWLLKNRMKDEDTVLEPEEFDLKMSWRGGGGENMLGYARLLSLPGGEEFNRMVKGRSCRSFSIPPRCEHAISLENERAALTRCLQVVESALTGYPTSVDEDDALLPTLPKFSLPSFLTLLRRDEKVVLLWWQKFWRMAIECLDLDEEEIEQRAIEFFGKYSPESQYIRVTISALVKVERSNKEL